MHTEHSNKRKEERVSVELPVDFNSAFGITRDVSASGMFFETVTALAVGSHVHLTMAVDSPWGKVIFKCDGSVVRIEPREKRIGVAVRVVESAFELSGSPPRRS
ncbi:MAG TPA: PilZ domain-containing protein [Candidatus Eisenbacteria bacterium]|nr:PilZ domain-containing protein [Candidatus Eisenbacteria bacterium]